MLNIHARNVNEALRIGVLHLRTSHRVIAPRDNETTFEYEGPVTTLYREPRERVLTIPERDINPFFHLFEALWILAGRNDVEYLTQFNGNMANYSDDGVTFNAPYGWRLRHQFDIDQIEFAIRMLKENPHTRRCVLQIWDPRDLGRASKDIPCNDTIFLKIRDGKLHITVCNRSNDIIWGAYGTNAVQFSMLQEYIACRVGVQVGYYHQVSDSYHAYDNEQWAKLKDLDIAGYCPYHDGDVTPFPLMDRGYENQWNLDLYRFMDSNDTIPKGYHNTFFYMVASPMLHAWRAHKENGEGLFLTGDIVATDWRMACEQWLRRREGGMDTNDA